MMFYPVTDVDDIVHSSQLEARGFWQHVSHPELGVTMTYPGHFCVLSDTECGIRRRAPLVGEHNKEVYVDELGLPEEQVRNLERENII